MLPRFGALLLVFSGLAPEGVEALRGGLGSARGPVLVAALDDERWMEGLALATGGRFISREFLLPVSAVRPEDLGRFANGRLDGGEFRFEGRADPRLARNWLRLLNRDCLLAESAAERQACRQCGESFLCALAPALRAETLKRGLAGKW
jgi:hypothetical protein